MNKLVPITLPVLAALKVMAGALIETGASVVSQKSALHD